MPPARGAVAFSSVALLLSNPWLRTLNKDSDQVPTFRNAPTALIPVTLPLVLAIMDPFLSQLSFHCQNNINWQTEHGHLRHT